MYIPTYYTSVTNLIKGQYIYLLKKDKSAYFNYI